VASNDYLGLAHDPRVRESAARAANQWGTSEGGSRFLCGNLSLYQQLEERLAAFLGKKAVVVHSTGFGANLGAISCLLTPRDYILCDRHSHASILSGCQASGARLVPFAHNSAASAARRLDRARGGNPQGLPFLISEGVFSMQGDVAPLPELVALKSQEPRLLLYLDDAHGLGVMGPGGRGTAAHFGLTRQTDFIMGTFSKSLASIGGFVAGDDETVMDFMRHQSRALIFSAALPAANLAAALTALEILEAEPERVERLWRIAGQVRDGFKQMGLDTGASCSTIIPVTVGDDLLACLVSKGLLQQGIFAPPAVFPAVPRGRAIIRVAPKSTHSDEQVARLLAAMASVAQRHGLHLPPRERPPINPGHR
jgi:glycine C-acetyltransferase